MNILQPVEIERALIARLFLEPDDIAKTVNLSKTDFSDAECGTLFDSIRSLSDDGKLVDAALVQADTGLKVDILRLSPSTFAPIEEYIEVILSAAHRRRLLGAANELIDTVRSGSDITPAAERVDALAADIEKESRLGIVDLSNYSTVPPAPLLGMLSPDGTTVIYGEGGDGKGWLAAKMIANLLPTKSLILDFENHPQEWAYRFSKFGVDATKLVYANPPGTIEQWANRTTSRMIKSENIGFSVVDSAMYASNSADPYSPEAAMSYKRARKRLHDIPTLLLAHVSKQADSIFGSVFWRNEARIVWKLYKSGQQRTRILECKKANNYPELEGKKYIVEFDESKGILEFHEYGQAWTASA